MKKVVQQILLKHGLFIHLLYQRTDLIFRKLPDVIAKQNLVFGQSGQRCGSLGLQSGFVHKHTFVAELAEHFMVAPISNMVAPAPSRGSGSVSNRPSAASSRRSRVFTSGPRDLPRKRFAPRENLVPA